MTGKNGSVRQEPDRKRRERPAATKTEVPGWLAFASFGSAPFEAQGKQGKRDGFIRSLDQGNAQASR